MRRQRETELNAGLLRTVEAIRLQAFTDDYLDLVDGQYAPGTVADQGLVLRNLKAWAGDDIETLVAEFGVPAAEIEDALRAASRRAA